MKKMLWIGSLVIVLVGAAVLYWMSQSGWVDDFNQEQNQVFQQKTEEGTAYGATTDQQQCLEKTLADFDGCQAFRCTVAAGKFLRACLDSASPSEGFCDGVPEYRDEPTEDDKKWAKFICVDRNVRGEGCRMLMRQQQLFCTSP